MKTTALAITAAFLLLLALGMASTFSTSWKTNSYAVPHSRIHR